MILLLKRNFFQIKIIQIDCQLQQNHTNNYDLLIK